MSKFDTIAYVIDDEATIDLDQVRARLWRVFAAYPFHLAPETDATMDVVLERRVRKARLPSASFWLYSVTVLGEVPICHQLTFTLS